MYTHVRIFDRYIKICITRLQLISAHIELCHRGRGVQLHPGRAELGGRGGGGGGAGGGGGPLRVRVPGHGDGGGALPGHLRPARHVAGGRPALPPGKQSKIGSVTGQEAAEVQPCFLQNYLCSPLLFLQPAEQFCESFDHLPPELRVEAEVDDGVDAHGGLGEHGWQNQ